MASKIDITKLDLYDILNVTEEATEKEVKCRILLAGMLCLHDRRAIGNFGLFSGRAYKNPFQFLNALQMQVKDVGFSYG